MKRAIVALFIILSVLSASTMLGQVSSRNRVAKNGKTALSQIYVDPVHGDDTQAGTKARPCKTISAALSLLPEEVAANVTVHLKAGVYATTGGRGRPKTS